MQVLDFVVLFFYFVALLVIGVICSRGIKKQEDFFLGGRGFGKLLQTFAAFGAGTGAQDPINLGRTTWTSGLSGIWSALNWLFVTPFYWIFAVWYRRMRHLTLGDWFVERYESKAMGVAYTVFAFSFQILYLSVMFSAISKVVEPLLGSETALNLVGLIGRDDPADLKYMLVPLIALVVIFYGILGGLAAAYWTDLIQGVCIILLSLILIPTGLNALVQKFGDRYPELNEVGEPSLLDGFYIMHQRLTNDFFQLFDTPRSGEFPIHFIVAFALISLAGIVVQPHMIATGGGSARSEFAARMGMVTGNFLKRFCTIGWALTGLIALALLAGNFEIAQDPDRVWGVASREILQPLGLGLVGLMLACLLAALMSSADCYMIVSSALLVRNVYAAYINPKADEKTYVLLGRCASFFIIGGAAFVSVSNYDVFGQYKMALEVAAAFSAPFWVGMFWRGATKYAAWGAIFFSLFLFFIGPIIIPKIFPQIREESRFLVTSQYVTTTIERAATDVDVEKRRAQIELAESLGNSAPEPLKIGDKVSDKFRSGGQSIFWTGSVKTFDENEKPFAPKLESISKNQEGSTTIETQMHAADQRLAGQGNFRLEFLLYQLAGVNLEKLDRGTLETLRLPPRILTPILVLILLSWFTPKNNVKMLDRYYVKMKTPVNPDPEQDAAELALSYSNPDRFDSRKLFRNSSLEFLKPRFVDVLGFVVAFAICFLFIRIILWLANIGVG